MLKFSKNNTHSNDWRTIWNANGNCETDYEIERIDGKYFVTVCMYKEFLDHSGSFTYLSGAKKWANTQNAYLDMIE